MTLSEWLAVGEIVRDIGIVVGGAVGLFFAGMRVVAANRQAKAQTNQAEMGRRTHVAELFNRAVGQLDDPKLHVRLGAIFTLRQIGHDFPDLGGAVYELLSLYLRENPRSGGDDPPADVQEIV